MVYLLLLCVACLSLRVAYGFDNGVGVYAYQDSTGKRYSGTFKPGDSEFGPFKGIADPSSQFFNNFFPEYFRNFQVLLNEAFENSIENQKLAYNAGTKAYDLTANRAGFVPNFGADFANLGASFGGFNPGFSYNFGVPNNGMNAAFASGMVGDGFVHQAAAINPGNPNMPNVDVNSRFAEQGDDSGGHFVSVQSSSYATSSNVNGKEENRRGAITRVNKDGKVTEYKVEN